MNHHILVVDDNRDACQLLARVLQLRGHEVDYACDGRAAMELFEAVRHLDPVILTGLPRGNWAADQKVRWAAEHFPGTRIITTMARDKRNHAKEGDVLIDDQDRHRHLWEEIGGIFIHHKSAKQSIAELREYFAL